MPEQASRAPRPTLPAGSGRPAGPARARRAAPLGRVRLPVCLLGLGVLVILLMLVACCVGAATVSLPQTWHVLAAHLKGRTGGLDPVVNQIVWDYRIPRVLLGALCGAGLAVAGAVLQALVDNPLADPYVVGLAPGASLGAVLVITAGSGVVGGVGVSVAAFCGALAAAACVFLLGQRRGRRQQRTGPRRAHPGGAQKRVRDRGQHRTTRRRRRPRHLRRGTTRRGHESTVTTTTSRRKSMGLPAAPSEDPQRGATRPSRRPARHDATAGTRSGCVSS
nr:iron chelate uptake ABC transporter family permease subunit [Frankia sp. AgKG'84/4]